MSESTDDLKRKLRKKTPPPEKVKGLSTGSTLLNLACSGKVGQGLLAGHYYFLVGDSASGKTFLALTSLAEASISPAFADYRLVYDDVEGGALMNMERFFGKTLKDRLEPPSAKGNSTTLEDFYFSLDDLFQEGRPFVYVLDSMDGLTSSDDEEKFREVKKATRKGKEVSGSYGTSKAKFNSSHLPRVVADLRKSRSILVIISQSRDNVGTFSFDKKTRSGGHALRFYATDEVWFSVKEKIRRTVKGKQEVIGSVLQAKVKKNRQTGREPSVELSFYPSVGIDDTGSCINFLTQRKHWKENKGTITADEFDFSGGVDELVTLIEQADREKELRLLVAEVWGEIEQACRVERKRRYE